jgi:hypothetical protein
MFLCRVFRRKNKTVAGPKVSGRPIELSREEEEALAKRTQKAIDFCKKAVNARSGVGFTKEYDPDQDEDEDEDLEAVQSEIVDDEESGPMAHQPPNGSHFDSADPVCECSISVAHFFV